MASTKRNRKSFKPKLQQLDLSIPKHFLCPISLDLMKDPVIVSTGITYDRQSIETWLDTCSNPICPVTNQKLLVDNIIPNHSLRRMIQAWCVANRVHGVERIPTPKIPITMDQAAEILSRISRSGQENRELIARIRTLEKESERNRRCFAAVGVARVLASLFDEASFNGSFDGVLEEILSTLVCFLPLDYEACKYLGSRRSLESISTILKSGDLSTKLNAITVLNEVLSMNREAARVATSTNGLIEGIVEVIRKPISSKATKIALATSYYLVSFDVNIATKFVVLGIVRLVLEILIDSDRGACEKALMVFDAICNCRPGREEAYDHALTAPVLVKKMFRVSDLATELVISSLWKLCNNYKGESTRGVLVEAIQVGAFQKVLLLLQLGCSGQTKEKATGLLKLMNGSKEKFDCIDVMDFKGLKRSF